MFVPVCAPSPSWSRQLSAKPKYSHRAGRPRGRLFRIMFITSLQLWRRKSPRERNENLRNYWHYVTSSVKMKYCTWTARPIISPLSPVRLLPSLQMKQLWCRPVHNGNAYCIMQIDKVSSRIVERIKQIGGRDGLDTAFNMYFERLTFF